MGTATDGSTTGADGESSARDRGETDAGSGGESVRPLSAAPGPRDYPVVGSTLRFLRDVGGFYDELQTYGDVVPYRVFGERFCAIFHPDLVQQVLVEDDDRFTKGQLLTETLGGYGEEGLLLTSGDQWAGQRRIMQPAFTPDRIAEYTDAMAEYTDRMVDGWSREEPVDVDSATSRLTFRILSKSLFDLDADEQAPAIRRAVDAINERGTVGGLSGYLPLWVPTPTNRRFRRRMRAFEEAVDELVEERRADDAEYDDLLSILLAATADGSGDGDGSTDPETTLTEREVRHQLLVFLIAGHETTSRALTYALYLLAHHPEKYAKLQAEVDEVIDGDLPGMADLPALEYTGRVGKEAMRIYPPAYVVARRATDTVEVGGYRIPEGTTLTLSQIRIHNDRRFYDDPDEFRPERWTDEFEEELPEYAYFPFGGGPRHCIGMRFARAEIRLALATIASQVDLEPVTDELNFRLGITLGTTHPVEVRVRDR